MDFIDTSHRFKVHVDSDKNEYLCVDLNDYSSDSLKTKVTKCPGNIGKTYTFVLTKHIVSEIRCDIPLFFSGKLERCYMNNSCVSISGKITSAVPNNSDTIPEVNGNITGMYKSKIITPDIKHCKIFTSVVNGTISGKINGLIGGTIQTGTINKSILDSHGNEMGKAVGRCIGFMAKKIDNYKITHYDLKLIKNISDSNNTSSESISIKLYPSV